MPGFDDSFLYDCAVFEQTNRRNQRQIRAVDAASYDGVILKSANSIDPDPFLADEGARCDERTKKQQERRGSEVAEEHERKRKTLAANVLEFLGSPRFTRRRSGSGVPPRSKLFGGTNCTYNVAFTQQRQGSPQVQRKARNRFSLAGGERFQYKRNSDSFEDRSVDDGDVGDDAATLFKQTSKWTDSRVVLRLYQFSLPSGHGSTSSVRYHVVVHICNPYRTI
ncbi:precorrin-6Y C5,15-methyltransferase [Anopheles sinensis]|uniref:Precorrin-6Y C5,15-methyltransferase n=1 Tax=Anopheles sinensis TaxID=74873 RepID=A0A084VGV0_ANOSI|nr:precorrin-6Y C5,15-methyltransferase [Anopheles sinensis]